MKKMKTLMIGALCLALWMGMSACGHRSGQTLKDGTASLSDTLPMDTAGISPPRYAQGFRVTYPAEGIRLLEVSDPQRSSATVYRYALLAKGADRKAVPSGYEPIEVPLQKVICMTSLQLSNFICLDACPYVAGITSTRHLFNPTMLRQLKDGRTQHIGIEGNFDNERIISINPGVIFISPFKRGGYDALRDVGVPLVPHLGYKEMTPLGQAEWIKFVAMFIGREQEADSLFTGIEQRYDSLKHLAAGVTHRPTVFSGEIRGGNWYAVGGRSFLAQLFRDAGAEYFLKDDTRSGGVSLDFETVYSQADDVDYWRIANSYDGTFTYDALKTSDPRYADFKAFRNHNVIYCNIGQVPFYESMPVQPDKVLADLIHVFHPALLPQHRPVYYERLKP